MNTCILHQADHPYVINLLTDENREITLEKETMSQDKIAYQWDLSSSITILRNLLVVNLSCNHVNVIVILVSVLNLGSSIVVIMYTKFSIIKTINVCGSSTIDLNVTCVDSVNDITKLKTKLSSSYMQ